MGQQRSISLQTAGLPEKLRMPGIAILAVAVVAPWFGGDFVQHLAVLSFLNVIIVAGLAVISRSGQLSLGHAAFVAVGAYVAVLTERHFGLGFGLSTLAGVTAAGVVAAVLGWVILRLKGVYFVLVTFAFGELARLALLDWSSITGGANGIANISPASFLGLTFDSRSKFYALAAVVALFSVLALRAMFRRPLGHAIDSVAENPALAESTGLSVFRTQLFSFIVGCCLAALGGVLQARYIGYVSPESFNTSISIGFIIMLVIGGRRSIWGPLVGALVLTPLPEFFRGAVQTQYALYGAVLVLILRFLPDGLTSLVSRIAAGGQRQA